MKKLLPLIFLLFSCYTQAQKDTTKADSVELSFHQLTIMDTVENQLIFFPKDSTIEIYGDTMAVIRQMIYSFLEHSEQRLKENDMLQSALRLVYAQSKEREKAWKEFEAILRKNNYKPAKRPTK